MDDATLATMKREIEATPDSVVLRSLRRHLWHALQSENADAALSALRATRADWNAYKVKQAVLQQQQQNNVKEQPKRRLLLSKKTATHDQSVRSMDAATPSSVRLTPTGTGPGLLQEHLNPTEPFTLDDYRDLQDDDDEFNVSVSHLASSSSSPRKHRTSGKLRQTTASSPRQAFAWAANNRSRRLSEAKQSHISTDAAMSSSPSVSFVDYLWTHPRMTTPLHEAARLASVPLLQLLLQNPLVDINARNGAGRTPLIMVAGGVTRGECNQYGASLEDNSHEATTITVGIRTPVPVPSPSVPDDTEARPTSSTSKAARAVRKLICRTSVRLIKPKPRSSPTAAPLFEQASSVTTTRKSVDSASLHKTRMAAATTILNYCHPDDGTDRSGQGASLNSVDSLLGRTALHYAAELGRTELCQMIANTFGTMLTVVDDLSHTPMELAGRQGHVELAAYLEARALLYIDPYGMDEELLAAVEQRQSREQQRSGKASGGGGVGGSYLAPPFGWYETWTLAQVQTERVARLDRAMDAIRRIGRTKCQSEEARKNMLMAAELQTEMPWVLDGLEMETDASNQGDGTKNDRVGGELSENVVDHPVEETLETRMDSVPVEMQAIPKSESTVGSDGSLADDRVEHYDSPPAAPLARLESETQSTSDDDDVISETEAGEQDDDDRVEVNSNAAVRLKGSDNKNDELVVPRRTDFEVFEHVHKSHIEILLKHYRWDEKLTMAKVAENPFTAFAEAGVDIPAKVLHGGEGVFHDYTVCLICCDEFPSDAANLRRLTGCQHSFCTECLGEFLMQCSKTKSTGLTVLCPHHACTAPLSPIEIAELAPSLDVYESLLHAANENFVVLANDLRFCPHAGCDGIVKFNAPSFIKTSGLDASLLDTIGAVCAASSVASDGPKTYEGVIDPDFYNAKTSRHPAKAHRFCFACGETTIHWPCPCDRLEEWKTVVEERVKEAKDEDVGLEDHNDIAQKLWLKTNTRPCPKCKAPIQKNEGCNHMTCSNPQCKFEFCWICRNDWKLHNSETGGFFRCNRWVDQKEHEAYSEAPADAAAALTALEDAITDPNAMANTYGTALHSSRVLHKKSREVARFIHHYQRWNAHAESCALEQRMSDNVCARLAPVVLEAIKFSGKPFFNFDGKGLSFVHSAFIELFECRSLLQHSYAFSFFRFKGGSKYYKQMKRRLNEKVAFEQLQSELELLTEQMSDVIARAHLRATQSQIMFLTASAAERRSELTKLIVEILHKEGKEKTIKPKSDRKKGSKTNDTTKSVAYTFGSFGDTADGEVRIMLAPEYDLDRGQEQDDDDDLEEAIRASLQEFRSAGHRVAASTEFDPMPFWECRTCTFVNTGSPICEICGARR